MSELDAKAKKYIDDKMTTYFQERRKEDKQRNKKIDDTYEAVNKMLVQFEILPFPLHLEQHYFIAERIEKEKKRKEFWRDVTLYMVKKGVWKALAVIGLFALFIWHEHALEYLNKIFFKEK